MIAGRLEIVDRAAELARSTNLYSEARQLAPPGQRADFLWYHRATQNTTQLSLASARAELPIPRARA
jgi:hypothetical protein